MILNQFALSYRRCNCGSHRNSQGRRHAESSQKPSKHKLNDYEKYLNFVEFEGALSDIVVWVHWVVNGHALILNHHELQSWILD